MSKSMWLFLGVAISFAIVSFGCGGGSGGSSGGGSGTVSMSITDAKPMLPETSGKTITNVFVTIDEILVHKSGGSWVSLNLPQSPNPFIIDLMQFSDGTTTELVPPAALDAGRYTQIRLSVVNAKLAFDNDPNQANWVDVTIPSENLKTDENFDFLVGGAAVDITIDFDLSKSLVLEGNGSYKLKPVLHINETTEAATVTGFIDNKFFAGNSFIVTVFDSNGEEYTKIVVAEKTGVDSSGNQITKTPYSIFWLVPDQYYTVKLNVNPNTPDVYISSVVIPSDPDPNDIAHPLLDPGEVYLLDFN